MKILIIEDEVYSRKSLIKQVRELDEAYYFEILDAANGRQGWQVFLQEKPEIVLTDIKMPFVNGLELLKLIIDTGLNTKVIMVSGFADFEFAREAINYGAAGYLLKPVNDNELLELLHKVTQQYREQEMQNTSRQTQNAGDILTQYLYTSIVSNATVAAQADDSGFGEVFGTFRVALLFFVDSPNPPSEEIIQSIYALCKESGIPELRMINFSKNRWGIVIKEGGNCSIAMQRIDSYLHQRGCDCYIGVSDSHEGASNLKNAYQQALTTVKSKLLYRQRVLYFSEIQSSRTKNYLFEETQTDILCIYLEKCDVKGTISILEARITEMFSIEQLSVASVENFLMKLTTIFYESSIIYFSEGEKVHQDLLIFHLLDYNSKEDLLLAIKKRVEYVCSYIAEHKKGTQDELIDLVLEYINQNYNKELSLRDMAENIFYLNHTYLSHLIREKTGQSYSGYLKQIRISKAKEHLKNLRISITEIATLSGYNDPSQFIQVFKKEVGMTPKRYRSTLGNK